MAPGFLNDPQIERILTEVGETNLDLIAGAIQSAIPGSFHEKTSELKLWIPSRHIYFMGDTRNTDYGILPGYLEGFLKEFDAHSLRELNGRKALIIYNGVEPITVKNPENLGYMPWWKKLKRFSHTFFS